MFLLIMHIILMIFCIYEVTKQDRESQKFLWTCMALCWLGTVICDISTMI